MGDGYGGVKGELYSFVTTALALRMARGWWWQWGSATAVVAINNAHDGGVPLDRRAVLP